MQSVVQGCNAKTLAKAIQSLSKFGVNLFMECDHERLQLRTLNSSHSVVGTVEFTKDFFESYKLNSPKKINCKLSMKTCLLVFRNMKNVEYCLMNILTTEFKLQVKLKCELETVKNTFISFVDDVNITAFLTSENSLNEISGAHTTFSYIVSNFNPTEEELTLDVKKEFLAVRNYVEDSHVSDKFMRTELKLVPDEFSIFNINQETMVTFCIKEFKAFLIFAEALNGNLILHFNGTGSPIYLSITDINQIKSLLIMSTLSPDNETDDSELNSSLKSFPRQQFECKSTNHKMQEKNVLCKNNTFSNKIINNESNVEKTDSSNQNQSVLVPRQGTENIRDKDKDPSHIVVDPISKRTYHRSPYNSQTVTFYDTEEAMFSNNDYIEPSFSSNNTKQVRSIFCRCFESTYMPRRLSSKTDIFACNSDTES